MIPYYSGIYTIAFGQAQAKSSILTEENIAKSGKLPIVDKVELAQEAMNGGDFFSNFKSFFTRTLPSAVKYAVKHAPEAVKFVKEDILPVAKELVPLYAEYKKIRGKGLRPHKRGLVGRGLGQCGECDHVECEGEGGCVACESMSNNIPEGHLTGENLRSRLVGNGLVIGDTNGFSRSVKRGNPTHQMVRVETFI